MSYIVFYGKEHSTVTDTLAAIEASYDEALKDAQEKQMLMIGSINLRKEVLGEYHASVIKLKRLLHSSKTLTFSAAGNNAAGNSAAANGSAGNGAAENANSTSPFPKRLGLETKEKAEASLKSDKQKRREHSVPFHL